MLSWDGALYKPNRCGGLAIRNARAMNSAFLMKLAWKVNTSHDDLWVRVLKGKYNCGNNLVPIMPKPTGDNFIAGEDPDPLQPPLLGKAFAMGGNGMSVDFWNDD
ncbi:LINE-1 reverse transcriptase isogeny [Sesbania bispinosa]|nr:LINE-1 reverse transcriptase isogeny [Sesbania bispinosa]